MKDEITLNGKRVDTRSFDIEGINRCDYPDFVDAYIASASFEDGTELTSDELNQLNNENSHLASIIVYEERMFI
jgi:hypothetical protein